MQHGHQRSCILDLKLHLGTLEEGDAEFVRIVPGMIGDSIWAVGMAPESIGPQAARLIGAGRDRIVSSYGLEACAEKLHDPNRTVTSQFCCRAIGNLSGGDHQPMWVPQKRLGDGASSTQAHIENTKLTASTVKPIGWRNAHLRSEKDWLKRHPTNAVEHGVGAQPEIGGQRWPSRRFQASLRETGMPRAVMRLSTLQPTLASTFCAGRVRARSVRPMMVL